MLEDLLMLIIDGHLDLTLNALQWGRDLEKSVMTLRAQEIGGNTGIPANWGSGLGTVALPEMRQGRIALCFATVIAGCSGNPSPHLDYASVNQANAIARGHVTYYRNLERAKQLRMIMDLDSLERHITEWETWDLDPHSDPFHTPLLGIVLSMEGADPILNPEELQEWWDLGLRMLIFTHFGRGRYAGGTGTELGLTQMGAPLLKEMERLGMLLDVTHFSDQAFWQAIECFSGPILASHSNCRALVPNQRQFSDEQIKAVTAREGVIGSCPDIWMLKPGWAPGDTIADVSLDAVVDHMDHVCQLAGNSRHAGIGSDLDGGYGQRQCPHDLNTIADLQKLAGLLEKRGYSKEDVSNLMYKNWLRLLRENWKKREH
jgi:membrane dipeptidase